MLIEQLLIDRERYETLMGEMINNPPKTPLTKEQKQKDILRFKFYEKRWDEIDRQIQEDIEA